MRGIGVLGVVCGVAVLTGCGGDGGALSRDELVSRADAICTKYEERIDALAEPQSIEEVEALADQAKPIVEDGVDELARLQPPEDLEDEYDRWIGLNRESVDTIDELKEAAAAGDGARVQQVVQDADEKEREADALARQIGLDECAND
jgi:signal transduction protein with GAF and PtsI domain